MKIPYLCTVILAGILASFQALAIDIQLQFTNDTDKALAPTATITYDQNGVTIWNAPIQSPTPFIAAHTKNAPIDQLRTNLDDYYLEYLELIDENHQYITNCLESYLPVTKSAIVTFRLKQMGREKPHYYCDYQIQYL